MNGDYPSRVGSNRLGYPRQVIGNRVRIARLAAGLAVAATLAGAGAQTRSGVFRPTHGPPAEWQVNPHQTLLWQGSPYLPVGIRVDPGAADFPALRRAGVQDVVVELPASGAGWSETLAALESNGLRYMIAIDSIAPPARGVAVEPQTYRLTGITATRTVEFSIPGATEAFVVLAGRRDGSIERTQRVQARDGRFSFEVRPPNDLDHVLLVYPVTLSAGYVDTWEVLDAHRDKLLRALRTGPLGPGLRGILNPLGQAVRLGSDRGFVPSSPTFRHELRMHLESKYGSPVTAMRSWALSAPTIDTFDVLSRLVPLWSGTRGVGLLWDPETGETFLCDMRRSTVWQDIEVVLGAAQSRRFQRLVSAIKQVADVPVLQEWAGWAASYEQPDPALDGIGARTVGTSPSEIADSAGRAASSVLRWLRRGWMPATHVDLRGAEDAVSALPAVLDDLTSLGARGWFVRSDDPAVWAAVGQENARRSPDLSLAGWSPTGLFFPESAANPAATMRLPGNLWWLPSPADGNRIDLGSEIFAYRIEDRGTIRTVMWTRGPSRRVLLRLADPRKARLTTIDGSNPNTTLARNGLTATIGELPLLIEGTDEIPVPQTSIDELVFRFSEVANQASGRNISFLEEATAFRDALNGLDRNPGGAFAQARIAYERVANRIAPFLWIEAEAARETNFSEARRLAGSSNGTVLTARSGLTGFAESFFAEYAAPVRQPGEHEVWVAARMLGGPGASLRVTIGGQVMRAEGRPVGNYGPGFGWFRMGVVRLDSRTVEIRVDAEARDGAEVSVDAMLLHPGPVTPNGVVPPDPMLFPPKPTR